MSFKSTCLFGLILLGLAVSVQAVTFGEQSTGDNDYKNLLSTRIRATQFVCPTNGNINTISIYVSALGTGGSAQVAVYDAGGDTFTPGALETATLSSSQVLQVGWNDFPITETPVVGGTTYWLVFECSNSQPIFRRATDPSFTRMVTNTESGYGDFPATFPITTLVYGANRVCMYAWDTNDMTPTISPTFTETPVVTATPTLTLSVTPSQTETFSATPTLTESATYTATPSITMTGTITPTSTFPPPFTQTSTPTFTATPTKTGTLTPTSTVPPPFTQTVTPTVTRSPTITVTATISITGTISPTFTVSPTPSPSGTITLTSTPRLSSLDLSHVIVHPNPWAGATSNGRVRVVFEYLTDDATISIYSVDGRKIRVLAPGMSADGGRSNNLVKGRAEWALTNENGTPVASGVYVYTISDKAGHNKTGKVALIR